MSITEREQLDELLLIADEEDTPLSVWDIKFLKQLDKKRDLPIADTESFDRLVNTHLMDDNYDDEPDLL